MSVQTTYYVRSPEAFRADEIAVDSPEDADVLAREGWRVRAVTRADAGRY